MILFSQKWLYSCKVVVFGIKSLYSDKSGYNWVKVVVFGQGCCIWAEWLCYCKTGCIRAKVVKFGQSCSIRAKWLYSGKVVVFGQSDCIWAKVVVFG